MLVLRSNSFLFFSNNNYICMYSLLNHIHVYYFVIYKIFHKTFSNIFYNSKYYLVNLNVVGPQYSKIFINLYFNNSVMKTDFIFGKICFSFQVLVLNLYIHIFHQYIFMIHLLSTCKYYDLMVVKKCQYCLKKTVCFCL